MSRIEDLTFVLMTTRSQRWLLRDGAKRGNESPLRKRATKKGPPKNASLDELHEIARRVIESRGAPNT